MEIKTFFQLLFALSLFVTILISWSINKVLGLAISVAAKLEPGSRHSDQFESYKRNVWAIAMEFAIGLTALAWIAGAVAGSASFFK